MSGGISIGRSADGCTIINGDGNSVQITIIQEKIASTQEKIAFTPAPASGPDDPNPYQGLSAFTETTADRFYGREALIKTMWAAFRDLHVSLPGRTPMRLLALHGPSGSGKSSLLRAGLLPELARTPMPGFERPRVTVLTPGAYPLEALARVVVRLQGGAPTPERTKDYETTLRTSGTDDARDGLRRCIDELPDPDRAPVIVLVDQFEELFTLCSDEQTRRLFIGNVLHAASDVQKRVSILITLRSDFLGEVQRYEGLNQCIADPRHGRLVPALTIAELRLAIAEPARRAKRPFTETFVDLLLAQVGEREGALPLLQFALTRIWDGLAAGTDPSVTLTSLGGVGGALAREAERIFRALEDPDQKIVRRAFLAMVSLGEGVQDTRRRARLSEITAHGETQVHVRAVLELFAERGTRLIMLSGTVADANQPGAEQTFEVAHEALFDHWAELKGWLKDSRADLRFHRQLHGAAENWKSGTGSLWRGPDLTRLRAFTRREASSMTATELRFFQASRSRARLNIGLVILAGSLILVAAVVAAAMYIRADRARSELADALLRSRDMSKVYVAERLLAREPWVAAALLKDTADLERSAGRQAAFSVTQQTLPTRFLPGAIAPMRFSDDAAWVLTASEEQQVRAYSLHGEPVVHVLNGPASGPVLALDVVEQGDAQRVAVLKVQGLELWLLKHDTAQFLGASAEFESEDRPQIQQEARGRIAVRQRSSDSTTLWELGQDGLVPVAAGLPCDLLDRGKLLCHPDSGPVLATYAAPTAGEPLPFTHVELTKADDRGVRLYATQADNTTVHLFWSGSAFIATGFMPDERPNFEVDGEDWQRDTFLSLRNEALDFVRSTSNGEPGAAHQTDALCRDRMDVRTCVQVAAGCQVTHVTQRDYIATCGEEEWRIFDRSTLVERQTIRRPRRCRGDVIDRTGRWLGCDNQGELWLWALDEATNVHRAASPPAIMIAAEPARAGALAVEPRGTSTVAVLHRLDRTGIVDQARREIPGAHEVRFILNGDVAGAVYFVGEGEGSAVAWIDFAEGGKVRLLETPQLRALGAAPIAVHAASQRLLAGGQKPVLFDFSGELGKYSPALQDLPCAPIRSPMLIAPDGESAVVTCGEDDIIWVELPSLQMRDRFSPAESWGRSRRISSLALSPIDQTLAIGTFDGTLDQLLRRGESWVPTALPSPHRVEIKGLDWSAPGLVSRDVDSHVVVWSADSSGVLQPLDAPPTPGVVLGAALTDDSTLLVVTQEGLMWTWSGQANAKNLRELIDAESTYCLTASERTTWLGEEEDDARRATEACLPRWREVEVAAK